MAQPTVSDVHINSPLTDISVASFQDASNFVASKVFPAVPVTKQSNYYYIWDKNNFHIDTMKKRAPGTETAGGGMELSSTTYSCDVFGLHKDIDDQTRANEDASAQLDAAVTKYLTQQALINLERGWASTFFGTGIWGTDVTGTTNFTKWDNTNSDPETDILTAKKTILQNGLQEANTLVVSYPVHQALKKHPLIKDRIKYTSSESITEAVIAKYFEVDRYVVSKAVYATNAEGAATDAYDFTHGKHALLCYVPGSPGLMTPSAGYTFMWTGLRGMGSGLAIRKFRMEQLASDRLEIEAAYDQKVISSDLGYFFASAVD